MSLELPDLRTLPDEVVKGLRLRALHAMEVLEQPPAVVAQILGVALETLYRWRSAYRRGGLAALPQAKTGRPVGSGRWLDESQAHRLQELIKGHYPEAFGINSALWTRRAVQDLIEHEYGVKLPIRTVGLYLQRWGFTPQKPLKKAYQQDPLEVQAWLDEQYPRIQARANAEGAEIHWGDETGLRSGCVVQRGYAPKGQTPELPVAGSRFSVNMISTVTNQGKVRFMLYEGRMNAARFIEFLGRLLSGAEQKLFLIVDHLSVHHALAVERWVAQRQDRIELFFLPKYAPELNPDEYLNGDVKAGANAHRLPRTRHELKLNLKRYMHKLAKLPARVSSYFQHKKIQYAGS
jgi:transposase